MGMRRRRKSGAPGSRVERYARTYPALASPEYRNLMVSGVFIFFGVQGQQIVRGILALEITGTSAGLGAVFLAFGIPQLLLTPFSGPIADRLPKRTVLLMAQALMLVSALIVAVPDALDVLTYGLLLVSAGIQGASFALYAPARMSFTSSLVSREALPNAIVLNQLTFNSTRVIGPALAGALVGVHFIGTAGVYLATAALIVASLMTTWRLPSVPAPTMEVPVTVFGGIVGGIRYVRSLPRIGALILVSAVVTMLGQPYFAFLPKLASDTYDAGTTGYAVMSAISAAAAVVISAWQARQPERPSDWRVQTILGYLFAVGLVLLGIAPGFWFGLIGIAVVGAGASGFQTLNNALVLTHTHPDYHGRVQSMMMLSFSGFFIISYPMGVLADLIGLRAMHIGMGVGCAIALAVYSIVRARLPAHVDWVTTPVTTRSGSLAD